MHPAGQRGICGPNKGKKAPNKHNKEEISKQSLCRREGPCLQLKISTDRAERSGHHNGNKLWTCGGAFCNTTRVEKPPRGQGGLGRFSSLSASKQTPTDVKHSKYQPTLTQMASVLKSSPQTSVPLSVSRITRLGSALTSQDGNHDINIPWRTLGRAATRGAASRQAQLGLRLLQAERHHAERIVSLSDCVTQRCPPYKP